MSWPVVLLTGLTVVGIYTGYAPMQSSRPRADLTASSKSKSADAIVSLKLWQDPFEGLQRLPNHLVRVRADDERLSIAGELTRVLNNSPSVDASAQTPSNPEAHRASIHILFVPLAEGWSPELRELRIRRRQAVLAALRASGMIADDAQHMAHFWAGSWKTSITRDHAPREREREFFKNEIPKAQWPSDVHRNFSLVSHRDGNSTLHDPQELQPVSWQDIEADEPAFAAGPTPWIAYEWFLPDPLIPDKSRKLRTRRVLLMWLPTSTFGEDLLDGLNWLCDEILPPENKSSDGGAAARSSLLAERLTFLQTERIRLTVLGPESSSMLQVLMRRSLKTRFTLRGNEQTPDAPAAAAAAASAPPPLPASARTTSSTPSAVHTTNPSAFEKANGIGQAVFSRDRQRDVTSLASQPGFANPPIPLPAPQPLNAPLAGQPNKAKLPYLPWLHIVSPASTCDAEVLLEELRDSIDISSRAGVPLTSEKLRDITRDESSIFGLSGLSFTRTIGFDSVLAEQLIQELQLRGVKLIDSASASSTDSDASLKLDEVALISEYDTLYGRAFPIVFSAALLNHGRADNSEHFPRRIREVLEQRAAPKNLRTYTYLRGVDGSGTKRPAASTSTNEVGSPGGAASTTGSPRHYPEPPLGDGQLDFIRRLALQLSEEYQFGQGRHRPLKAIGIIGSDVYDKLLILQALRQVFPNAIFFTTDLDARLYQADNLPWTRNLLVASHFGLALNRVYQRGLAEADTPSFRDAYQTSYFFSTRFVLGLPKPQGTANEREFWSPQDRLYFLHQPRIFEIGRERAIDLSRDPDDLNEAERLHPRRHMFTVKGTIGVVATGLAALTIVGVFITYLSGALTQFSLAQPIGTTHRWRPTERGWWVIIAVLMSVVFIAVTITDHFNATGERWSAFGGTSVWPSLALRLFAIYLSTLLTFRLLKSGTRGEWLEPPFATFASMPETGIVSPPAHVDSNWLRRAAAFVSERWRERPNNWHEERALTDDGRVDVARLWSDYRSLSRWSHQLPRAICLAVLLGIAVFLLSPFCDPPRAPYRGTLNWLCYSLFTAGSDGALAVLTFLVVDRTVLASRFVTHLSRRPSLWPEAILTHWRDNTNLTSDDAAAAADVRFVATLTDHVGKYVYYPFAVLVFVVLARLDLFDAPSWTPLLVTSYAIIFCCIASCVFVLRRAAEQGRRMSVDRIQQALLRTKGQSDKQPHAAQLELLLKEVTETRRGAFAPIFEDPLFAALLLPSGSLTVVSLIERWLTSF